MAVVVEVLSLMEVCRVLFICFKINKNPLEKTPFWTCSRPADPAGVTVSLELGDHDVILTDSRLAAANVNLTLGTVSVRQEATSDASKETFYFT